MAAESDQKPLDLKLVFLGDSAVGKTALLRRFNTGFPPDEDQPRPVDAYNFTDSVQVDGKNRKKYLARCWEVGLRTNGIERLRPLSYPGTDIFCYVLTLQIKRLSTTSKTHGSQKFAITCHTLLS